MKGLIKMNYIIVKGKLNGKWTNGLTGTKRSLNAIVIDESAAYKASFWQEEADKVDEEIAIGDEVCLFGQIAGLWIKDDKPIGIEIVEPEIQKLNSRKNLKSELIRRLSDGTKNEGRNTNE